MTMSLKMKSIIRGMQKRGDKNQDIAAWFGINQGRISEAINDKYGTPEATPQAELPPRGPTGVKGRRIRDAVRTAIDVLEKGEPDASAQALALLKAAAAKFDANES